jgi:hypothetical protein
VVVVNSTHATARIVSSAWTPFGKSASVALVVVLVLELELLAGEPSPPAGMVPGEFPTGEPSGPPVAATATAVARVIRIVAHERQRPAGNVSNPFLPML